MTSMGRKPTGVILLLGGNNEIAVAKSPSLTMSAVSSTFRAHDGMHSKKSAISLSLKLLLLLCQPRLARNQFPVRNSVRPIHLFDHNCDHDYYFELPCEGERDAQSLRRCFTAHHGDFRALPRTNRTSSSARSPIPCATSSTCAPPVSGPSPPWRSSVLAASPGGNTYCAIPGRSAP